MFTIDVKKEGRDFYTLHFLYDQALIDSDKKFEERMQAAMDEEADLWKYQD